MTLVRSAGIRLLALAACWVALVDGDPSVLSYGAATVPLATALSYLVTGAPRPARPGGARRAVAGVRLAGWIVARAAVGGVDVASRVLRPGGGRVDPYWRTWTTTLADDRSRAVLALALNLMPGTLSAAVDGDELAVHVIGPGLDVDDTLRRLERRVAAALEPGA